MQAPILKLGSQKGLPDQPVRARDGLRHLERPRPPDNSTLDARRSPRPADPRSRAAHELRDLYDEVADLLDDDKVEALPAIHRRLRLPRHDAREPRQGLPGGFMYCDGIAMLRDRILAMRETQVYEPRSWRISSAGLRIVSVLGDVVRARANVLVTRPCPTRIRACSW
jgi:3-phenylpropionate/cinnamic acid dioxygenase small subunit